MSTPASAACRAAAGEPTWSDLDAVRVGWLDKGRRIAPEEHDERDALFDDGRIALVNQHRLFGVALIVDDHVDAERSAGQLSRAGDLLAHVLRWMMLSTAEYAEAARIRDRGGELRAGRSCEADRENRMLDPERGADPRRRHGAFVLCLHG